VGNLFGCFPCQHRKKKGAPNRRVFNVKDASQKTTLKSKEKNHPLQLVWNKIINRQPIFLWVENGFVPPKNHPQDFEMLTHFRREQRVIILPKLHALL